MATTSYGYPGSINAAALAIWAPNVAGAQYSVDGPSDCKAIVGTGDRGIQIKTGTIIGDGIVDIFTTVTNLNLASVASGDRWDMIVCRRTWSSTPGASTSVFTIIQGSATKGLPSRNNNKGVQSDQPIALVRVRAGSTSIQEIVDLRCWAHNGGVYAMDELVKSYLDQPGTHLTIGEVSWVRIVSPGVTTNDVAWLQVGGSSSINLFNRGSQSIGNPSKSGTSGFLIQSGQELTTIESNDFGRLFFPTPFPNGLLTCFFQPAADNSFNDANIAIAGSDFSGSPANKTFVAFRLYGASGGTRHKDWDGATIRYNWLAIGY